MTVDYEAKRALEAERLTNPQVGDLLYTSWGYDQTNVEFFQVVERTAKSVKLRRIAARYDEATRRVYPAKDEWARDWSLDGNASWSFTNDDGELVEHVNEAWEQAEKVGYSETGWRRITGHGFRVDTGGYIRHAYAYTGGGAWDTIAAGEPGH